MDTFRGQSFSDLMEDESHILVCLNKLYDGDIFNWPQMDPENINTTMM